MITDAQLDALLETLVRYRSGRQLADAWIACFVLLAIEGVKPSTALGWSVADIVQQAGPGQWQIKKSIRKTDGKRGEAVVQKNFEAVDATLANLYQVTIPAPIQTLRSRSWLVRDLWASRGCEECAPVLLLPLCLGRPCGSE
jgi:hypothetical protein